METIEQLEERKALFTTNTKSFFEKWKRAHFAKNMIPLNLGVGCCSLELIQASSFSYESLAPLPDIEFSPEESDLLIVSGSLNIKWAQHLLEVYQRMCAPKWVVSIGTCANSGSIFSSYSTFNGLGEIMPVDLYIPGCPPSAQEIQRGLLTLKERIEKGVRSSIEERP